MLTPFQRTSTLLVQCTSTPHKPWARLPPLITPLCSAILSLVLKLHFLSLKTHVTFHLLLSRWVNVFLKPLLPQWRKGVATKLCRHSDGSPKRYPFFRQGFHQRVQSKALHELTKITCLLQFLEGPALRAVQRHEAVPGGLASHWKSSKIALVNHSKL